MRYTRKRAFAISLIRGSARAEEELVLSKSIMRALPFPNCGKSAVKITMIPSPPSQWVRARKRSRLFGTIRKSGKTVAPVPVIPEILSTSPSKGESSPLNT